MQPPKLARLTGNRVGADDGYVELGFSLGNVARGAVAIVKPRPSDMTPTGFPDDIIVTRTAGHPGRIAEPHMRFAGPLMASGAVSNILRKRHRGVVVDRLSKTNNLVRSPGFHTGKVLPPVDLVDHLSELHGVSRIWIQ